MKRVVFQVVSLMMIFGFLLSGCNTAQPTTALTKGNSEATATPALNSQSLSATETAFANRIRPTRSKSSATATVVGPSSGTAAAGTPTAQVVKAGTAGAAGTTVKTPAAGATAAAPSATQQPTSSPILSSQPSNISLVGAIPVPEKRQTLNFGPNSSVLSVAEYLNDSVPTAYQFNTNANQVVYLAVFGRTNIQVYDAKMAPVTNNLMMPGYLSLVAAESGTYTIVLSGLGNVTLSIYLPPAESNLAGASPVPAQPQAVELPVVPLSVSFYQKLDPAGPVAYTFPGQAGQRLTLLITGNLTATLILPDGNTADAEIDTVEKLWIFQLPETGSYTLVFLGVGVINVTAKITPPVAGSTLATPQPGGNTPILIAPDRSSISLSTYLVPEKTQSFVLHLAAKQLLVMDLTANGNVNQIVGPGNTPVITNHADITKRWSSEISQEGDYIITISGKGPSRLTFSLPTKGVTP